MTDVIDVKNFYELPTFYMMFPDDVEAATKRIEQIEEKLLMRDKRVVRPLRIFRINQHGKTSLAVELQHIDQDEERAKRTKRKHAKKGKFHDKFQNQSNEAEAV